MNMIFFWIVLAGVSDGIYRCAQSFVPKTTNPAAITLVLNIFAAMISLSVLLLTSSNLKGVAANFNMRSIAIALIIGLGAFLTDYSGVRALTNISIAKGAPLIFAFLFLTCAMFIVWEQLQDQKGLPWDLCLGIGLIICGSLLTSRHL